MPGRVRLVVAGLVVLGLLAVAVFALDRLIDDGRDLVAEPSPTTPPDSPTPTPSDSPAPTPTPTPTATPPVLSLPGDVPDDGPGSFRYAEGEGEVFGDSGSLLRYRVAVEDGIEEHPAEFAALVDDTLGAEDGWTAGGQRRLQRVPDGAGHDFTVYLATSGTTERMCAAGGLDVTGSGLPDGGVSCRVSGQAIINLHRWRLSVPHFRDNEVPLLVYRQMVVNHEVGHQFGYGHERCPGAGEPAPVMQQQTLRLDGCEANPWPYVDGERHTGPPVS